MLKKERQAYILQKVNLHNKVLSSLLCSEINVSEDTIRRDLQELADEGKVIKVHGKSARYTVFKVTGAKAELCNLGSLTDLAKKTEEAIMNEIAQKDIL